jgi:nucleotide-binding universal stress UspA family protein
MFKNILIPTDGSKLAARGIKAGVKLAKSLGAKVTGVYVAPPYMPPVYGEAAIYYIDDMSQAAFDKATRRQAGKALDAVKREAAAAGVRASAETVTEPLPYEGILKVARSKKCDAIVMSSHGRSAVGGLILGSETNKVLAHSKIPVVVVR